MKGYPILIKPYGEKAILIEWPNEVNEAILDDILQFMAHLKSNCLDSAEWEFVPAYNSLTLISISDSIEIKKVSSQINQWYASKKATALPDRFLWKLPVCYDLDFGIDLTEVSLELGMEGPALISLHTKSVYTVYGIGFLPGFMYLGGVPKTLEIPRRAEPRPKVSQGSVGLAGKQTGIYPQDSPGGWNIIGNCPIPIFNVAMKPPCFVGVGDKVQFYSISRAEYNLHKIEAEVGIYQPEKEKIDA